VGGGSDLRPAQGLGWSTGSFGPDPSGVSNRLLMSYHGSESTAMSDENRVILHLSDLHFGCDRSTSEVAGRELALQGLLTAVQGLEPEWRPTIICITGDIGWRGQASDYTIADEWLSSLLSGLGLRSERVFPCAGNHDIDRAISQRYARPKDGLEADRILAVPFASIYIDAFHEFSEFCKALRIPPYKLGDVDSYLVGERSVQAISICAFNSSWFCQGDDDRGKLWIGRPQIDVMEHGRQLCNPSAMRTRRPTIALLHHPKEWFHDEEIHARGRQNTFDVLARRCHLMLTGHAHGETRRADQYAEAVWHLGGGATYAGAYYFNTFCLIRVNEEDVVYRSFEYDPRSADREWRQTIAAQMLPIRGAANAVNVGTARDKFDVSRLRSAAASHARALVDLKSRALRPWGPLPDGVPLHVLYHVPGRRQDFGSFGEVVSRNDEVQVVDLSQATRNARRTLLLGDLGAGKSTLAGRYVVDVDRAAAGGLAVLVPARMLSQGDRGPAAVGTARDFLGAVSAYFNGQIDCIGVDVNLEALLRASIELTLVIDGLDEVRPEVARCIVERLAELADFWANIQVLATGRPVELVGLDYSKWQVSTTAPLADAEKLALFVQEGLADGNGPEEAHSIARVALGTLQGNADLSLIATTPLFCRLLFKHLAQSAQDPSTTLGDLLYVVLKERLADWAARDSKGSSTPALDRFYPDADSRLELLAGLAVRSYPSRKLNPEAARLHLRSAVDGQDAAALAEEALRCFTHSGLIRVEDGIEFTLQAFLEFLSGYAYAVAVGKGGEPKLPDDLQQWRTVSFAATMARRLSVSDRFRPALDEFVRRLLHEAGNVAAASYVVSEFRDAASAASYIGELKRLAPRPLRVASTEPAPLLQGARATAEAIYLAGDAGFAWFFDEYLDPRYPYVFAGSLLTDTVFRDWTAISMSSLPGDQRAKLSSLAKLHVSAGSDQLITIIPALAVVIPEAFSEGDQLWFCAQLLAKEPFRRLAEEALRAAIDRGAPDVGGVLVQTAQRGFENAKQAALLYLSAFEGQPPLDVIQALLRTERTTRPEGAGDSSVEAVERRLGKEVLGRLLRWYLFDPNAALAAGAAIELYSRGERRLSLLGSALLPPLHDGGYVAKAEEVLRSLVVADPARGIAWMASSREAGPYGCPRSHSGWWRVFLSNICSAGPTGPGLLAECISGIGEFLLSRNPEIRQGFRHLLAGPQGASFYEALRACLSHSDPGVRHGAAMVLVACNPAAEGQAWEEVVRAKGRQFHGLWHEWEGFCLGLRLGASAITHLKSKFASLPEEAQVFALALLYRNGTELEPPEFERLVEGELKWVLGVEGPSQALQSQSGYSALVRLAEGTSAELAPRAAQRLLELHAAKLSEDQRAYCTALASDLGFDRSELLRELRRMEQNARYAESITRACQRAVAQGYERPLIDRLWRATTGATTWDDIVWNELGGERSVGLDADHHGQWLLDFMRSFPAQSVPIGRAALKFLFDARLRQPAYADCVHWLALLAHEARELTKDDLERVLTQYRPIRGSATTALLARLERQPQGYRRKQSVGLPVGRQGSAREVLAGPCLDALQECARSSEDLHPELCATIERCLLGETIPQDKVDSLCETRNGILIAGALAMAYDQLPDVRWACRILGHKRHLRDQEQCAPRLFRLWRSLLVAARENNDWREHYTSALRSMLRAGSGAVLAYGAELLAIEGVLEPDGVANVLSQLPREVFDDYGITRRLSSWLSGEIPAGIGGAIAEAAARAISVLDTQPWDSDPSLPKDPGPYLLAPLLVWKITNRTDGASKRVFLRGLRAAFMPERQPAVRESRREDFQDVMPLLASVPKSLIDEAIRYSDSVEDASVRALCKLLILP